MKNRRAYLKFIGVCMALSLAWGCGEAEIEVTPTEIFQKNTEEKTSMLEEAEILYEVQTTYPGITVDTYGYEAREDKVAILVGETLPAIFVIRNADNGEEVYRGSVKRKDVESSDGLSVGVADFSMFTSEGRFYIQADVLGKSKNFVIGSGIYKKLRDDAFSNLHSLRCQGCHIDRIPFENDKNSYLNVKGGWHTGEDGLMDVVEGCLTVMDICTLLEYYPDLYDDEMGYDFSNNGIPDILDEAYYEVEWLLRMQNQETGGVYTSVSSAGKEDGIRLVGGETTRATAYFCACMARFSSFYKKYDNGRATEIFQAAVLAWNCLAANKDIVGADQMYRAAVEMYRASGLGVYNEIILEYLKGNAGKDFESRLTLDAAISYLGTPRKTNVDYCSQLMAGFMDRTEEKVLLSEKSRFCVESEEMTVDELLSNVYELMIVDYIISSNAYVDLEADYIHYMCGRNMYSIDYLKDIYSPDSYVRLMSFADKLAHK